MITLSARDVRELSTDELDSVTGGSPVAAAAIFFGGWLAGKTLDSMGDGDGWIESAQKYAKQQKGGKKPA
jgi:hypothetical protein